MVSMKTADMSTSKSRRCPTQQFGFVTEYLTLLQHIRDISQDKVAYYTVLKVIRQIGCYHISIARCYAHGMARMGTNKRTTRINY